MSEIDDALAFYAQNYDEIGQWFPQPGQRLVVGNMEHRRCRFCGLEPPEATFKAEAHAIPELTGNHSIFTAHECDACNHLFGRTIENDLGNWSKVMRAFARIRGKNSAPALKGPNEGWRIDQNTAGIELTGPDHELIVTDDPVAKTLTFVVSLDTHTPIQVFKAFVKVGLSLLPPEEVANFEAAIAWVREPPSQPGPIYAVLPVLRTMRAVTINTPVAFLLRRSRATAPLPYVFLVLAYGREIFQVSLPCPEQEAALVGCGMRLCHFPFPMPPGFEDMPPVRYDRLNLSGTTPIKGQESEVVARYDEAIPRQPAPALGA